MWAIKTTDLFDSWFCTLDDIERASVLAALIVLRERGPNLPRPYADTVKGTRDYNNIKELRIQSRGNPLRAFFAFDPCRTAILLCAGNKVGNEKRFYHEMIPIAEQQLTHYLNHLKKKR